ncbi:hypothetical protein DL93DRAFT_396087 [Clavulina sp. PMI_390]|nr:hypothetical protein DL93DRAFT_396087 [Clavulina sp. PMI_390]
MECIDHRIPNPHYPRRARDWNDKIYCLIIWTSICNDFGVGNWYATGFVAPRTNAWSAFFHRDYSSWLSIPDLPTVGVVGGRALQLAGFTSNMVIFTLHLILPTTIDTTVDVICRIICILWLIFTATVMFGAVADYYASNGSETEESGTVQTLFWLW